MRRSQPAVDVTPAVSGSYPDSGWLGAGRVLPCDMGRPFNFNTRSRNG